MARRFIEEFDSGNHSKYLLYYHLVIVTKYRKPFLLPERMRIVEDTFIYLSNEFGIELEEMNGESDHIHFLFRACPDTDLPKFIHRLKGRSSYLIRKDCEELRQYKAFWSGSYCLLTTGGAPIDIVKQYIISQGRREHHEDL